MTDNLYRFTFTLEDGSTFTCNAEDRLEAMKHLERVTGEIMYTKVDIQQVIRALV